MHLPTEKTLAKQNISDFVILTYGVNGVGKSAFWAQALDALFLATEPGLNALDVFKIAINSYEGLLDACNLVATEKHSFKTTIIDTADEMYRLIAQKFCKTHRIEHESDLGFSKGWTLVASEVRRIITKLAHLPYGLVLTSHAEEKTIKTRNGGELTQYVPSLPKKAREAIMDLVDLVLFFDIDEKEGRVIRTKPTPYYFAKDRTNRLPETMALDYQTFVNAFNGTKAAA